jgi:transcriptional regulator with XRE-family HTH domain
MTTNDLYVGTRAQSRRETIELSVEDVASAIGCDANHLQQIEAGARRPSAELLIDLAEQLEVKLEYFFDGLDLRRFDIL